MTTKSAIVGAGGFSLHPEAFEQGGGLKDKVDAKIVAARFNSNCTYGGRSPNIVRTALELTLQTGDGEEWVEYFSAGNTYKDSGDQQWGVTNDGGETMEETGKSIVPVPIGGRGGLNSSSNLGVLTQAFSEIQPADNKTGVKVADIMRHNNADMLVGIVAHWQRKNAPELTGVPGGGRQQVPATGAGGQQRERERTILCPVAIIRQEGAAAAPKAAAPRAAAATPRAAAPRAAAAAPKAAPAAPAAPKPAAPAAAPTQADMDAVQGALTVAVAEGPKLLASAVTAVIQAKTGVTPRNVSTILMNDAGLSERLAAMGFVYNAESQEISLPTE